MTERYIMGVDLGTSGCKVALVDDKMRLISTSRQTYAEGSCVSLHPGWVDQDPEAWLDAVKRGIAELVPLAEGKVEAIGFSAQMHGLIALDANGQLLRSCITCNDGRTAPQCDRIYELLGGPEAGRRKLLECTNNYMFPSFTATKILWMKENEPELFAGMAAALNPKDYLRYRMTGEIATDVSDACGYGLFDPKHNCWSGEILSAIGIPEKVLPKVVESNAQTGVMRKEMAEELGLTGEVKVIAGGGDAVVQTTGCGAVRQGVFTVTLGTGSLIGASFEGFKANPYGTPQMFRSNAPGRFMAFGGTGSGGGALAWLEERFFSEEKRQAEQQGRSVYALMSDMASEVPAGSQGLYFYPQLVGQRCPFEDNDTSGAYIGMRMYHDKRHFVRSLMEGVALCLLDNYDMIREMCGEIEQISITGGGASSDLWCQIHADVFGVEVVRYESYAHGGAVGACMIAGLGVGLWNSLAEAADMMQVDKVFAPDPEAAALYQKMLKVYKGFYPALRQTFKLIAEQ